MKSLDFSRYALSVCVATAMLAGCGGSQPPIGAPFSLSAAQLGAERKSTSGTYSVLYNFKGVSDGAFPRAGLLNVGSTLYGTTPSGGAYGEGAVFRIKTDGSENVLYSFKGTDGRHPVADLIAVSGTLYGTTRDGGAYGKGTVFSITTGGQDERVLHDFGDGTDGAYPYAGLIDVDDTLYGTTAYGGAKGAGTIFWYDLRHGGHYHMLYGFGKTVTDGRYPEAGLILVPGTLYGTTYEGGAHDKGTVFRINLPDTEEVLYSFGEGTDGFHPRAGLIDVRGTLYGTTRHGGRHYHDGTVFSITTDGTEKVLHVFGELPDGYDPDAGLIDVSGTLYGTTAYGGAYSSHGTIFSITTGGTEKVLHSFGEGTDGQIPVASLIDASRTLYGTTSEGGANRKGTVFSITP
jgi:uncharacterized repeat protein (TIGR03803 family)